MADPCPVAPHRDLDLGTRQRPAKRTLGLDRRAERGGPLGEQDAELGVDPELSIRRRGELSRLRDAELAVALSLRVGALQQGDDRDRGDDEPTDRRRGRDPLSPSGSPAAGEDVLGLQRRRLQLLVRGLLH